MAVVLVVALAGREDRHDQELRRARDRPGADVEPRDRGPQQRSAAGEVAPHGDLVAPEAREELVDLAGVDVEDDADRFHRSPPVVSGQPAQRRAGGEHARDAVDAATRRGRRRAQVDRRVRRRVRVEDPERRPREQLRQVESPAGDVAADVVGVGRLDLAGPVATEARIRSRNPGANRSTWLTILSVASTVEPFGTWQ
jgi:hypothetical protein